MYNQRKSIISISRGCYDHLCLSFWKNHFYRLLCRVNRHKRNTNVTEIFDNNMIVTVKVINKAIKELSKGKSRRPDNICCSD